MRVSSIKLDLPSCGVRAVCEGRSSLIDLCCTSSTGETKRPNSIYGMHTPSYHIIGVLLFYIIKHYNIIYNRTRYPTLQLNTSA